MSFEWYWYLIAGFLIGFLLALIIFWPRNKVANGSLEFKQVEDREIMQWNLPLEPEDIKKQKQIIFDVHTET